MIEIPVMRPRLPVASDLVPYLERIDAARYYTNRGGLSRELENALATYLAVDVERIVLSTSGSMALLGAMLVRLNPELSEPRSIVTSAMGFVASASAIKVLARSPRFLDVDPETWVINVSDLRAALREDDSEAALVVAPYGRCVDWSALSRLEHECGKPVIVDAAASLDQVTPVSLRDAPTTCFSMHATKAIPAGELGVVVARTAEEGRRVRAALNHGFAGSRVSFGANINGKPSEYTCAVGLASIASAKETFERLDKVRGDYLDSIARRGLDRERFVFSPDVSRVYALLKTDSAAYLDHIAEMLRLSGIGSLRWYEGGIHRQPSAAGCMSARLKHTEHLCDTLLGLPMSVDQAPADTGRVVEALLMAGV